MVTTVASRLASISKDPWPGQAFSEKEIAERLEYWGEHLTEAKAGSNMPTVPECLRQIDRWLDEKLELRGR